MTHSKFSKLLALVLVLAMVLPMVMPGIAVSAAEESVVELPTETIPGAAGGEAEDSVFYQTNFSEEANLADFDLYQSGSSQFVISDGQLKANGTDGEQKAILKQGGKVKSLSVNIIPGESGVIYGGVYFGAKDAQSGQDQINSQVILIKSDYTGWSDALNRIDIVYGQFNGGWKEIKTTLSETGNSNNLFSGGKKEPLNLRLDFSYDVVLLTLSLVSDSSKYIQLLYEIDPALLEGQVGLRSIGSDTCYDKLIVNHDYVPETLTQGLKLDGTDEKSYAKTLTTVDEKPVTIEAWVKMEKPTDKRRQAIISNYTGGSLAANSQGTWGLYTDEDGDLWYTERCGGTTYNQTERVEMWSGQWTHVAIVRGQGVLRVYANGELVIEREKSIMGEANVLDNYLTIGYCTVAAGGESTNSTQGEIGDIRLWSTERTLEQIQDNMYRELTGKEEGLIQHWNFDSHKEGIISNTVEGGVDLGVMGHGQIGDEGIYRWDFSDAAQLEDFTTYADAGSKGTNAFSLTGGVLKSTGGEGYSNDMKAILNTQIDNIKSISAEITGGGSYRVDSGFYLGVNEVNSSNAYDLDAMFVRMGAFRTSSAKRPYGEIEFYQTSGGTASRLTKEGYACHTTFYPGSGSADKLPTFIKLAFDGNTINALQYRIDDPTVKLETSYTVQDGMLDGKVGIRIANCKMIYDNLVILTEEPTEVPPVQDDSVTYNNDGYNFLSAGGNTWEMKQDITTPYTLEAWVKVPAGIAGGTTGYIVGNAYRAPHVSMLMAENGNLRLTWTVENADLTTSTTNFDPGVDIRTGKWTHVAYTCDVAADTVICYVNGQVMKTWTNAGLQDIVLPDHVSPDNWFAVGSVKTNMGASSNQFPGWIADVRLWDRALTASEIGSSMMTQYTAPKAGLLLNAPLNDVVNDQFTDLSGNGNHLAQSVTGFQLETQDHEPGAYSMVVIPDQQILSHYYNDALVGMYQWIADNREKENIQIVMNVGDMADNCGNLDQWSNTKAALELLPDDLPFIAAPGNHDYDTNSGWNKGYGVRDQLTLMNQYLPRSMFEGYPTEIGFFDEVNSANQWQAFTVNGHKYLVMALEYVPQDDVIAWANQVAEEHPDHQIIMVTHSYVGSYGNLNQPKLWNAFLSQHENVIMAFSGHVFHTEVVHRTDKGVNGNDVHNILMDAQGLDTGNRKHAMIGILRFNADGTLCDISYYSTSRDQYEARSNFTVTLPEPAKADVAKVGDTYYASVTEAAEKSNGAVVELLANTDEAITITGEVTLDLAGFQLTNVTVDEGAVLNLIDSTATYDGTNGSAAVTGNVPMLTEANGKKYMVIGENGVYAAHRYYLGITHVSLEPAVTGFGYKAQFLGDAAVQTQVKEIGYDLWLTESKIVTKATTFQETLTLRLNNFLVESYGEAPVNARAFMILADGTKLEGAVHAYSMRSMVELINATYTQFTEGQLKAAAEMILANPIMLDWEVENILGSRVPAATVETFQVKNEQINICEGYNNPKPVGTANMTFEAYSFVPQDTLEQAQTGPYSNWIADYYVSMDREVQEGLYLVGNYGSFGWVAFEAPAGQTYTDVGLMTTFGRNWTYEQIVGAVDEFKCGVMDLNRNNTGATFTVQLRLVNPADANDYIVVTEISTVIGEDIPQAQVQSVTVENQQMQLLEGGTTNLTLFGATQFSTVDTAESVQGNLYADWNADYYVSLDQQTAEGLYLAGNYGDYGWIALRVPAGQTYDQVPVVATLLGKSVNYQELVTLVGTFTCGAADTQNAHAGATMTVELRLVNPADASDYIVINQIQATVDPYLSAGYETIGGAVSVADTAVTATAANTLALHESARLTKGTYFAQINTTDNTKAAGIVFGANEDATNYYLFRLGNGSKVELVQVVNGAETVLDTGYYPANRRKDVFSGLEIVLEGDTIHGYIHNPHYDRIHCFSVHENAQFAGDRVGLWSAAEGVVFQEMQFSKETAIRQADVVIFGHSYTEMWTNYQDYFPEYPSIDNVGLGGSVAVQWEQFPEEIASYNPKLGIYLIGINDLTGGTTPKAVVTSMEKTLLAIKELVPEFEVVVTAVNHCPNRATITAEISQCNALMRNLAASYDWIYYAETEYALCADPSDPLSADSSLFSDGLHPNAAGYTILVDAIRSAAKGENQPAFDDALAQEQLAEVKAAKMNSLAVYGQASYTEENWALAEPYYNAAVAKINGCATEMQLKNLDLSAEIAQLSQIPNKAAGVIANLLDPQASIQRDNLKWVSVDDDTINLTGYTYSLDNTAVYRNPQGIFKFGNNSGAVGTAGLLLNAHVGANKGMYGYLINCNTNGNYIQIYYVSNSYNNDGSTSATKYIGGIVLNNYGIRVEDTEFWFQIDGDKLYVNTVDRIQKGEANMLVVDLTYDGTYEVYESGYVGMLAWAGATTYDIQLRRFAAEEVIVEGPENLATEILANLMDPESRIKRSSKEWTQLDANTMYILGSEYILDKTATYTDAEFTFKLTNPSAGISTGGILVRATASEGLGIQGYLVNINTNSNYIQVYHLNNNYNADKTTATHTYVGGVVLNNYELTAADTEYYVKIEGSTLYVNTVARQEAGTKMLATIDLTKGGAVELYESGYTGLIMWDGNDSADLSLYSFFAN